jgi:hypothetical protein
MPGWQASDATKAADRERGCPTVLPAPGCKKPPQTIDVENRGYGGGTVIRNLTDGQTTALAQRMDRHGRVSIRGFAGGPLGSGLTVK